MSAIRTKSQKKSGSKSKRDADYVEVKLHSTKRIDDLDRENSLTKIRAKEAKENEASGSKAASHKIEPEGAAHSKTKGSQDKKSRPSSRSGSKNKIGGRPRDDAGYKSKTAPQDPAKDSAHKSRPNSRGSNKHVAAENPAASKSVHADSAKKDSQATKPKSRPASPARDGTKTKSRTGSQHKDPKEGSQPKSRGGSQSGKQAAHTSANKHSSKKQGEGAEHHKDHQEKPASPAKDATAPVTTADSKARKGSQSPGRSASKVAKSQSKVGEY